MRQDGFTQGAAGLCPMSGQCVARLVQIGTLQGQPVLQFRQSLFTLTGIQQLFLHGVQSVGQRIEVIDPMLVQQSVDPVPARLGPRQGCGIQVNALCLGSGFGPDIVQFDPA